MSLPRQLLDQAKRTILGHLPAVRDGASDAIHEARIATRRLREILPLLGQYDPVAIETSAATAKRLGRVLGTVRELDVLDETLSSFEQRLPMTAAVTATARTRLLDERRAARRRLVKVVDAMDLQMLDPGHVLARPSREFSSARGSAWKPRLRRRLGTLAADAATAIHHASGVYLPNRSHELRVVVKKLRYALETAGALSVVSAPTLLADLQQTQSRLGQLHDLHVLRTRLEDLVGDASPREQTNALVSAVEAEEERRQRQYLRIRDQLLASLHADAFSLPRQRLVRRSLRALVVASAAVSGLAVAMSQKDRMKPLERRRIDVAAR